MPNYSSYKPNTPVASQPPSQSPGAFNTNFGDISGLIGVDHATFTDATNGGYHNKSTYPVQSSAPGSGAGQVVQFAKTINGNSEQFIVRDASGSPIQMTAGNVILNQTGTYNSVTYVTGQSFLPGGLQMKWGLLTPTTLGATNIPVTFTNFGLTNFLTACFGVTATTNNTSHTLVNSYDVVLNTPSSTGFTIYFLNKLPLFFVAIGN